MPDVVAEGAEGILGLHLDDHYLRAQLGRPACRGRAGMACAAHHDVGLDGFRYVAFGDVRLVA